MVDPHGQGPIAREAVDVAVTGEDVRAGHPVEVDRLVPAELRVLPIGIREVAGSERVEGDRDRAAADRPERRDRRRSLVTGGPGGPGRPHGELVRDPQPDRQLAEEREGDVRGLGEQLEEPGAVHLLDHHVGAGGDGGVAGLPVEEGELADRFAGADGGHVQTADGDLGGPVDDDPPPVGDLSLAAEHRALGDLASAGDRDGQPFEIMGGATLEQGQLRKFAHSRSHLASPHPRRRRHLNTPAGRRRRRTGATWGNGLAEFPVNRTLPM